MTSALVTDIPVYQNVPAAPVNPKSKENPDEFMQVMNSAMNDGKSGTDILADHLSRPNSETGSTESYDLVNTKPKQFDAKDRVISQDAKKPVDKETQDKVKDALNDYGTKVRDTIKESMDVTDEEITEAMEALGFTYADLLNPDNLKVLLSGLSDEEQLVSLLTDSTFPNLLSTIEDFGSELIDTLQMEPVEIKGVELDLMIAGDLDEGGIKLPDIVVLDDEVNTAQVDLSDAVKTVDLPDDQAETTAPVVQPVEDNVEVAPKTDVVDAAPVADDDVTAAAPETAVKVIASDETDAAKNTVLNNDETDDLAEVPEEGIKNIVENTGETTKNNAGMSNTSDNAAQEMLDRSRDGMTRTSEMALNAAEHTATQTFTQTVITAAGEQTVELVQSYTSVDTQSVISQIVTQARTTISETVSQMEMMLNPENLGRMILQVTQQEGAVTARFIAQSEGVREALQMQMELLRESLNQAGIKVNAIEVSAGTHEFERNLEEGMTDNNGENTENPENGQGSEGQRTRRDINFNDPDEIGGVMSEEEMLVASMMRDQGNTMNVTA